MRDFFKLVFATFLGLLLFSTVSVGGLIVLLILIATGAKEIEPLVEDDSLLLFDLSVDITDAEPSVDPGNLLGQAIATGSAPPAVSLHTVLSAIEAAATDDRIVGIVLEGNINPTGQGSGFATLREVHQALETFQATSGKPILAYNSFWAERDYYLTSLANEVFFDPSGVLQLDGLSAETTFFAGALDRFGVDVQVVRVGNFKSAVEPFTRTNNSPENRQQTQALLDDLWSEFRTAVATSRETTPEAIQAIANTQGILLPTEAQSAGLVDQVAYADQVLQRFHELTGEATDDPNPSSYRSIDLVSYAQTVATETERRTSENRVAVVYAEGTIVEGSSGPGLIGGDELAGLLRELRLDDSVKAVVLRINSPGGGSSPSEIIAREVQLTREAKPVIVSMGSVAASGGYMIAAPSDRIFASPNTITGSIGVFGMTVNVKEIANDNGITWDVVKTAPLADSETIARPLTAAELAILQRLVDQTYEQFVTTVAESRNLPRDQVLQIAQGRVWSGVDAQQVGLVDDLGGLNDAIQAAVAAAQLGDDWQLDEYPQPRTLEEQILQNLGVVQIIQRGLERSPIPSDPVHQELAQFQEELHLLTTLNDSRRVYTLLPFLPQID